VQGRERIPLKRGVRHSIIALQEGEGRFPSAASKKEKLGEKRKKEALQRAIAIEKRKVRHIFKEGKSSRSCASGRGREGRRNVLVPWRDFDVILLARKIRAAREKKPGGEGEGERRSADPGSPQ